MFLFLPFGILYAVFDLRTRGGLLIALWCVFFAGFIFLLNYLYGPRSSYVVSVFHISSMAMVAVLIALGSAYVFRRIEMWRLPWQIVFPLVAAVVVMSGLVNREFADNSKDLLAWNYGKNILKNVARDGVIFSHLETESFPIANIRAVSAMRRDILLFGNQGDMTSDIYTVGKLGDYSADTGDITGVERYTLSYTIYENPVYFTFHRRLPTVPDAKLFQTACYTR